MKAIKPYDEVSGDSAFRSRKFRRGSTDPYEDINGKSNRDGIDRSELNANDRHESSIDQDFVVDFDGDEDFYGDDESNQTGYPSYTGVQYAYIGNGEWVDKMYGEHQFDHKGDVDYQKRNSKNLQVVKQFVDRRQPVGNLTHYRRRFKDR